MAADAEAECWVLVQNLARVRASCALLQMRGDECRIGKCPGYVTEDRLFAGTARQGLDGFADVGGELRQRIVHD